ncbi:unnamed protein product [Staurois parvus]|uniref:Uncharacterized protein n=1 Tax=Staurois parvus TaxID=386267 RepID=A0ABN9CSL2_9NEOB|nr:unnamed protein product [Staurois parvus]
MEASEGHWQRGVEDTEWRPVKGLAERGGGHCVEASEGDWQRGAAVADQLVAVEEFSQ